LCPRPGGDVRPRPRGQAGLSDLLPVALRAARAGAAVLLRAGLPRPGSAAELKSRGDYVTATDRASEVAILEALAREAPAVAVVATGFPFRNKKLLPRYLPVFRQALETFEDIRRAGAAALDLAWTAASTFDGFFELGLNTWDVAAGAALVLEVGGRVSDW